jgi:hypothetical protein
MASSADAAMPDGASSPTCVLKGLLENSYSSLHMILTVLEEDVLSAPRGVARMQAVHAAYSARCNKVKDAMASEGGHPASMLLGQILEDHKHDDQHDADGSLYQKLDLGKPGAASCVLRDVENLNTILDNMTPHIVTLAVNNVGVDEHTFLKMVHICKAAMLVDATEREATQDATLARAFTVRVLVLLGMMDQQHKIAAQNLVDEICNGGAAVNDKNLEHECKVRMWQFMTRGVPQRVKHVDLSSAPRESRKVTKSQVESCLPPLDASMGLQTALESMCAVAALLGKMDEETKSLEALLPDNAGKGDATGPKRKKPEAESSVLLRAEALLHERTQSGVQSGAKQKRTSVSSYTGDIKKREAEMNTKLLRLQTMLEACTGELNKPSYSSSKAKQANMDVYELYATVYNMAADCMQRNIVASFVKVLMNQMIKNTDAEFMHKFALSDLAQAKMRRLLEYEGGDIFAQRTDAFSAGSQGGLFASKQQVFMDLDWCLCLQGLVSKLVAEVPDSESGSAACRDDAEECREVLGAGTVLR